MNISNITGYIIAFKKDSRAVTAIEYGLIAACIAVAIIASVKLVGTNLTTMFNNVATNIASK